jgi:hypothetical protein
MEGGREGERERLMEGERETKRERGRGTPCSCAESSKQKCYTVF